MANQPFPKFKSSAPLQAGLYYARKRTRLLRQEAEPEGGYIASTPNSDAESGTEGDGKND